MREQRRLLWQEGRDRRRQERKEADRNTVLLESEQNGGEKTSNMAESKKTNQPQFYQIRAGEEFRSFNEIARKQRLQKYVFGNVLTGSVIRILAKCVGHSWKLLFRLLQGLQLFIMRQNTIYPFMEDT